MNLINDNTNGLTSEAAVAAIGNRYELVIVGARRMRELSRGDIPRVTSAKKHSHCVTAMLEIEQGKVDRTYLYKEQEVNSRNKRRA